MDDPTTDVTVGGRVPAGGEVFAMFRFDVDVTGGPR